jgi:hypothetical protein
VDATKLLGGYLDTEPKATGGQPYQAKSTGSHKEPVDAPPTLAELGLTKKESMNAQLLHSIAKDAPELFEEVRKGMKSVTAVTLRQAKAKNPKWYRLGI